MFITWKKLTTRRNALRRLMLTLIGCFHNTNNPLPQPINAGKLYFNPQFEFIKKYLQWNAISTFLPRVWGSRLPNVKMKKHIQSDTFCFISRSIVSKASNVYCCGYSGCNVSLYAIGVSQLVFVLVRAAWFEDSPSRIDQVRWAHFTFLPTEVLVLRREGHVLNIVVLLLRLWYTHGRRQKFFRGAASSTFCLFFSGCCCGAKSLE